VPHNVCVTIHILTSVLILTLNTHIHVVGSPVLSLSKLEYARLSSKSIHASQSKIISFRVSVSSSKSTPCHYYLSDMLSSPNPPCRSPESHQEMLAKFRTRCCGFVLHHLLCNIHTASCHDTLPKLCSWMFVAQYPKNQEIISSPLFIWLILLYTYNVRS
jgi:hypothetical protein